MEMKYGYCAELGLEKVKRVKDFPLTDRERKASSKREGEGRKRKFSCP